MNNNTARWLAVSLSIVFIVGAILSFILSLDDSSVQGNAFAIANSFLSALSGVAFGLVGALILARQPRHTVAWLLVVIGIGGSVLGPALSILGQVMHPVQDPDWTTYLYFWANGWIWWVLMGPLLLILLVFPTGRVLSPRWGWVVSLIGLEFVSFLMLDTLNKTWHDPNSGQVLPGPFGVLPPSVSLDVIIVPWGILFFTTGLLCVTSVLFRYRRSNAVERQQLKWFFYACAIFLAGMASGFINPGGTNLLTLVFDCALLFIPVSIGIAILRYHLFDIDIIIRRTLIYSVLTAMLALFYLGSVFLLQQLLRGLTGQGTDLAIILSTLGSVVLFNPLRRRIQQFIDRRFYRRKYNAARVLAAFGATVRDGVDLTRLTDELQAVVEDTMQPEHVSLWIKPT